MPNASYPDDGGSRTASGAHDEGRARNSVLDVHATFCGPQVNSVEQHLKRGSLINGRTDSSGTQATPYRGLVDGDSNSDGDYTPAAYPASSGTNGQG